MLLCSVFILTIVPLALVTYCIIRDHTPRRPVVFWCLIGISILLNLPLLLLVLQLGTFHLFLVWSNLSTYEYIRQRMDVASNNSGETNKQKICCSDWILIDRKRLKKRKEDNAANKLRRQSEQRAAANGSPKPQVDSVPDAVVSEPTTFDDDDSQPENINTKRSSSGDLSFIDDAALAAVTAVESGVEEGRHDRALQCGLLPSDHDLKVPSPFDYEQPETSMTPPPINRPQNTKSEDVLLNFVTYNCSYDIDELSKRANERLSAYMAAKAAAERDSSSKSFIDDPSTVRPLMTKRAIFTEPSAPASPPALRSVRAKR